MKTRFQSYEDLRSSLAAVGYADPKSLYTTTKGMVAAGLGLEKRALFTVVGEILWRVMMKEVEFSEEYVCEEITKRKAALGGGSAKAEAPEREEDQPKKPKVKKKRVSKPPLSLVESPVVEESAPPAVPYLGLPRPMRRGALSKDIFKGLAAKKCPLGKSVDWVMQHLDDPDPDMDGVPSLAAWSLRSWAMTNAVTRSEFYRTFACKRLPTQRMIEIQERMRDDGRDIDARILEVITKQESRDDEVLSESSEDSGSEYELPEEYY